MSIFAKEFLIGSNGSEYTAYEAQGWSRVTICQRAATATGSFTANRKKRSAFNSFEDAFRLRQNVPLEMILGRGDVLYVQGAVGDLIEVTGSLLPFGEVMGGRPFPAKTETRRFPVGSGTSINPDEFCEITLFEAGGTNNGFVIGFNKERIQEATDPRSAVNEIYQIKSNREDKLYVAGATAACNVSILITSLPVLGGVIGELLC